MGSIRIFETVEREYHIDKRKVSSTGEIFKILKGAFEKQEKEPIDSIRIYADTCYDRVIIAVKREVE